MDDDPGRFPADQLQRALDQRLREAEETMAAAEALEAVARHRERVLARMRGQKIAQAYKAVGIEQVSRWTVALHAGSIRDDDPLFCGVPGEAAESCLADLAVLLSAVAHYTGVQLPAKLTLPPHAAHASVHDRRRGGPSQGSFLGHAAWISVSDGYRDREVQLRPPAPLVDGHARRRPLGVSHGSALGESRLQPPCDLPPSCRSYVLALRAMHQCADALLAEHWSAGVQRRAEAWSARASECWRNTRLRARVLRAAGPFPKGGHADLGAGEEEEEEEAVPTPDPWPCDELGRAIGRLHWPLARKVLWLSRAWEWRGAEAGNRSLLL